MRILCIVVDLHLAAVEVDDAPGCTTCWTGAIFLTIRSKHPVSGPGMRWPAGVVCFGSSGFRPRAQASARTGGTRAAHLDSPTCSYLPRSSLASCSLEREASSSPRAGSLRPAGAALIGLGVVLLVLAVISAASYNAS